MFSSSYYNTWNNLAKNKKAKLINAELCYGNKDENCENWSYMDFNEKETIIFPFLISYPYYIFSLWVNTFYLFSVKSKKIIDERLSLWGIMQKPQRLWNL